MKKILIIGVAALLISCNTQKKQLDRFRLFAFEHPDKLAELCKEKFPVKESELKPGKPVVETRVEYVHDGDSIPCPPNGTDTIWLKKPAKVITNTVRRTDTLQVIDQAALADLQARYTIKRDSLLQVRTELELKKRESKYRLWVAIGLGVAFIGMSAWKFFGK